MDENTHITLMYVLHKEWQPVLILYELLVTRRPIPDTEEPGDSLWKRYIGVPVIGVINVKRKTRVTGGTELTNVRGQPFVTRQIVVSVMNGDI